MNISYSANDLEAFLVWVGSKNLMKIETLNSLRVASGKVLAVLDEAERHDLRQIDREQVFARFQNAAGSTYNPSSLNVYRSRFNTALDQFTNFHGDRSSYKASNGGNKSVEKAVKKAKPSAQVLDASASNPHPVVSPPLGAISSAAEGLTLPIPIRPGVIVKIFGLPSDLSVSEAKKVCAVISAYAVE